MNASQPKSNCCSSWLNLGETVNIPADALRMAADRVSAFVAENKHLLPYTYQFKTEIPPDPRMATGFSSGGMSGIRLPGDSEHYYFISAGLNECRLEKSDKRGVTVEERDLRGERNFMTDGLGMITIRRTRAKADLLKALPEIKSFLLKVGDVEITKSIG